MQKTTSFLLFLLPFLSFGQQPKLIIPQGHTSNIVLVSFSPDGQYLLSSSEWDGSTIIWDAWSGRELRHFNKQAVSGFSPDGRYIAVKGVEVLDVRSGKVVGSFPEPDDGSDPVALFSPDNKHLLTKGQDSTYVLWDISSGKAVQSFPRGDIYRSGFEAFSADGQYLAIADGRELILWDVFSGKRLQTLSCSEKSGPYDVIISVAFSPDGQFLLAEYNEGHLHLWEMATAGTLSSYQHFDSDGEFIEKVMFSPDGRQILIMSDKKAFTYSLKGKKLSTFPDKREKTPHMLQTLAFSPDGRYLATGGIDEGKDGHFIFEPKLWDRQGNLILKYKSYVHFGSWLSDLSPDGRLLYFGGKMWDLRNQSITNFPGSYSSWSVTFSPDNQSLWHAGVSTLTHFRLDETVINKFRPKGYEGDNYMNTLSPSADGQKIMIHSNSMNITKLFDLNGKELQTFKFDFEDHFWPQTVVLHPDGQKILTATEEIILWDMNLQPLQRFHNGHTDVVNTLAFSPDGNAVLSGSNDKTAKLWDINGNELQTFAGHEQAVTHVDFFPDGQKVLTISGDEVIHIWEVESGQKLASLMLLNDSDWVVTTPSGLFDASPGAMEMMYFLVDDGEEWGIIELDHLKDRYYEPGLLQKILGYSDERIRPVENFNVVKLFPKVAIEPIRNDSLTIRLIERNGGIGKVRIFINGKEVMGEANPLPRGENAKRDSVLRMDLKKFRNYLFRRPDKTNIISVQAFNEEGWLRSRGINLPYRKSRSR